MFEKKNTKRRKKEEYKRHATINIRVVDQAITLIII